MQPPAAQLATSLWQELLPDIEPPPLHVSGSERQLPSTFRIERLAGASIAAAHMSASVYYARKQRRCPNPVWLDLCDACVAFCSEQYLRIDDKAPLAWGPLTGDYPSRNGRFVRLHCNFEHHARAAARALRCDLEKDAFSAAIALRDAVDVEEAVLREGGACGSARSRIEWERHPHYAWLKSQPLIAIEKAGETAPLPLDRPLRVLDLTRIIAGPLASKVLATYGAEVLHVASRALPTIWALDVDHGFGKQSCDLDLRNQSDADSLRNLIGQADVILESYRPGALERFGLGFEDVRRLQPRIVYVSLSAYGHAGPWGGRRGFDSVVQMTSGVASTADPTQAPQPLPCQALDHATGYLAAFATMGAAIQRARRGGAWRVGLSLARTAELLWSLGLDQHFNTARPEPERLAGLLHVCKTPEGRVTHVPVPGRF